MLPLATNNAGLVRNQVILIYHFQGRLRIFLDDHSTNISQANLIQLTRVNRLQAPEPVTCRSLVCQSLSSTYVHVIITLQPCLPDDPEQFLHAY